MIGGKFFIDCEYFDYGIYIVCEFVCFDIGQGCVVCKGIVFVVEVFEGIDVMFCCVGEFKIDNVFFVKIVKMYQDYCFDVFVFGQCMFEIMCEVGLYVVVFEVGCVIMIDKFVVFV